MDAALIQQKLYYGYSQAAKRVGSPCDLYRPFAAYPPMHPRNLVGQINAGMTVATSQRFNFEKPPVAADYVFTCLADGRLLQVGDYLQRLGDSAVFFIGAMEPIMPIVAVRCNQVVSFQRRVKVTLAPGLNPYQGPTETGKNDLIDGVPAAIMLQSTGRNTHGSTLPSDAPGPLKYQILLSPGLEDLAPVVNDFVYDDAGRRFMVAGVEKTPIALRLDTVHLMA